MNSSRNTEELLTVIFLLTGRRDSTVDLHSSPWDLTRLWLQLMKLMVMNWMEEFFVLTRRSLRAASTTVLTTTTNLMMEVMLMTREVMEAGETKRTKQ